MPALRLLSVLVAAITTIGMTAISGPALASPSAASPACTHRSTHAQHLRGMVLPVHAQPPGCLNAASTVVPGATPPLLRHQGVVMAASGTRTVTITPIWWAPSGYSFPSTYQSLINRFVTDVAADSGKSTNAFAPLTQYTDASGNHISYKVVAGAPISDTNAFRTGDCYPDFGQSYPDGTSYATCVTDPQIGAEVTAVTAARGLPKDAAHLYVVMLPKRVEACGGSFNISEGGDCSAGFQGGSFCAFHSWTTAWAVYALMPYANAAECSAGEAPNGNLDADDVTGPLSHEVNEAITDPTGQGWYDSSGYENGDECAWIFGSASGTSGSLYNQTINGHHYYLQEEFSNESYAQGTGGCVQHQTLPKASFTVTSSTVRPGTPVGFNASASTDSTVGSLSSYTWAFGDGSVASGVTTSHAFAVPGTYTTTLTVTDADGWQAKSTHSEQVGASFAPTAPRSARAAQASSSSATLTWSPPTNPGTALISGYTVSRDGIDSSGGGAYSASIPATTRSFTFTKLVSGRTYHLSVRAVSAAGTGAGATIAAPIASIATLSAPASLSVAESAAGAATTAWQPPVVTGGKTITGYRVSRDGVDSSGGGAYSTTVTATARSFAMTKLVSGSTYTLTVAPVTSSGVGPTAAAQVVVRPYLSAPQAASVSQGAAAAATIRWQAPATLSGQAVTGYVVSRDGVDSAGHGAYLTTVGSSATSFTMTRLVVGTTYTLSVQAITAAAVSNPANVKVTITF
ncbi:MAG TPA: fibronectin type III domain-containing protein [Amnibacterium sp.]|nr:fibronectin type III domain-containing protein [Amnibacterium sp.]